MQRDGVPIADAPVSGTVDAGITYGVQLPGMVPRFEELTACAEAGYSAAQWAALPWQAKAEAVAWYRLRTLVKLHVETAVAEASKRRAARKR